MKRVLSSIFIAGSLLLGAVVASASYAADAPTVKPDAKKGEQLFTNGDAARGILACASCHGAVGNSTIPTNPNLAAQPHEYLAKQLSDFQAKNGKVPLRRGVNGANTIMSTFAALLTSQDMQNIALYLSHQRLDYSKAPTATNKDLAEAGQKIWRAGVDDRRIPACAACHSANGAGLPGEFPRLAGQFPSYIAEQLKLFRSGDRANSDIMHDIANRMTDAEIAAVADYAAGLR